MLGRWELKEGLGDWVLGAGREGDWVLVAGCWVLRRDWVLGAGEGDWVAGSLGAGREGGLGARCWEGDWELGGTG